ncbi:hypothetical protein SAZ11_05680 [Streptomyces sp. FXJ1.4098]|nr:hypothetical protein [Streptomyces sp. FXJ1.4098]
MMGLLAVVAGVAISPGLIAGSTLLESLAPRAPCRRVLVAYQRRALGIALGTAVGGRLADPGGFEQAAWAAVGGGILAMGLSLVGQSALLRTRPAPEAASGTTV